MACTHTPGLDSYSFKNTMDEMKINLRKIKRKNKSKNIRQIEVK